jgi:hypothetical protein
MTREMGRRRMSGIRRARVEKREPSVEDVRRERRW